MSRRDSVESLCKDIRRICTSGFTVEEYGWAINSFASGDIDRLAEMYPAVGWTVTCHAPVWLHHMIADHGYGQNSIEGSLLVGVFALASDSCNVGILDSSRLSELTRFVASANSAYEDYLSDGDTQNGSDLIIGYLKICLFAIRYLLQVLNSIRGGPMARELKQSAWNSTRELQRTIDIMARAVSAAECRVWDLAGPPALVESYAVESAPAPESEPSNEATYGEDTRHRVDPANFAPYGRFRGICKLFMHFETTPTVFTGTGWLIDANTVVTAAHCVLPNYDNTIHALSSIEVYCGYDGEGSKNNRKVDYRYGTRVTVPGRYWNKLTARHDIAMITMDRAFPRHVTPLIYKNTPSAGSCTLEIPGFPADKERGHRMYTDEKYATWYDLPGGIFRHKVNTYKGQSGSPILAYDDENDPYACQVIAVHTQSGNSGTCIGPVGNDFDVLLASLRFG